jgi:type III secretory pathway component EscT
VHFALANPKFTQAVSLVLGACAAAYLWAVVTGHGIAGLQGTTDLTRSDNFPDANAAFLAAFGVLVAAPFFAAGAVEPALITRRPLGYLKWCAMCAVLGGGFFGAMRLFAS